MNLNRNDRRNTLRNSSGTRLEYPNNNDWRRPDSVKSHLILVGKKSIPSVTNGIRREVNSESIFSIVGRLVAYPTDALAKFIGWFTKL